MYISYVHREKFMYATETDSSKIPCQLSNRRRKNIFSTLWSVENVSQNRAERSNYHARGATILLILPARRKKTKKDRRKRQTERIANTERTATRTIAIGRSLFSALLRRKRVAEPRTKT